MLKYLRSLVLPTPKARTDTVPQPPPSPPRIVSSEGALSFSVADHIFDANGFPLLDWSAAREWIDGLASEALQARAWSDCEHAWLEHLRSALGPDYRLRGQDSALLLSTLDDKVAEATLAFLNKTLQRVLHVLDGIAHVPDWGHDILLVFDDDETYYRYISHYYREAGAFAGSGGIYIGDGCSHFATMKVDLRTIEPVIAHELTHACLGHLPIPTWLNEGIAVNIEQRLCPSGGSQSTPRQMHARHREFWGPEEIQQFWSGKSFMRPDDGNELSYDLARIIVSQLGSAWDRFRPFVLSANVEDGGASAAAEHLDIHLGAAVSALLELDHSPRWEPDPTAWIDAAKRGDFDT